MSDKLRTFGTEEEMIAEALISALTFKGKQHDSLELSIENMPEEFWSKLTEKQRDEVEKRLKKYFEEET